MARSILSHMFESIEKFRINVIKKHGGTLHEKAYLGLATYIEFHFTELHPLEVQK